jgi:hypothetical protein
MFILAMINNFILIALPAAMAFNGDHTRRVIMADQPDLDPSNLDMAVYLVLGFAFTLHIVDVILNTWFSRRALQGHRWARIALTIFLVFITLGSFFSIQAVPDFWWVAMTSNVIHVTMIILLWVPAPVRQYFAAHRAAAVPAA